LSENLGFDFGFRLVDEDQLDAVQNATHVVQSTVHELATVQDRLDALYNSIQPLLNNLSQNPEKDYILWPGEQRMAKIEEFSDLLRAIYQGN
jgi:hypothetical protein